MVEMQAVVPESMSELFVAAGHPDQNLVEQIRLRGGAVVKSLLGGVNEVWLGKPQAFDLLALFAAQRESISPLIAAQTSESDFVALQLACSFRPAPECDFIRASVRVWLEPGSPAKEGDAVAVDMFPREIETPITTKRSYSFSPELKFNFNELAELEASLGKAEHSTEYIIYEPEITTFALGERAPGWDFNKTRARTIRGSKELFLVVKKPKGSALWGRFEITATVRTSIGRIPLPTFFARGGTKPIIDERHLICR